MFYLFSTKWWSHQESNLAQQIKSLLPEPLGHRTECVAEEVGVEPTFFELTARRISFMLFLNKVVGMAGLEPARLSPTNFKSVVATDYTTSPLMVGAVGVEPTSKQ